MKKYFKNGLNYLLTGSFTVVFAACYGAPVQMLETKIIKTTNFSSTPIPGLKVTIMQDSLVIDNKYTDSNGVTEFVNLAQDEDYDITIEDIDGIGNGGMFALLNTRIPANENYIEVQLLNEQ